AGESGGTTSAAGWLRGRGSVRRGRLSSFHRAAMHVLLCVEAAARADALRRLLRHLTRQRFTRGPEPGVSVVVVDGSPGAVAERAVAELREMLRWPVEYVAEPAADLGRRKVVALALGCGADCVAFLDADAAP